MKTLTQIAVITLALLLSHGYDASAQDESRPGDGGENIAWVQQTLNGMGYDCGSIDGAMGSATRSCLRAFQAANSLEKTGTMNEATYETMLALLESDETQEEPEPRTEPEQDEQPERPTRRSEPRSQSTPREQASDRERQRRRPARQANYKDPGTATLYSVGLPGGGQLWAGETTKGALILGTAVLAPVAGYAIASSTCSGFDCSLTPVYVGSLASLGAWIYGIVGAGDAARRCNERNGLADAGIRIDPKVDMHGDEQAYGIQLSMTF